MIKSIQIRYNEKFDLACRCAAKAGFENITVNFSHGLSMDWSDKEKIYSDIAATLERYSLLCNQSHLPCYGLTESSEVVRKDMEDCIHKAVEISGRLGAKWCAYHTRDSLSTGFLKKQTLEDNYNLVSDFLETAVKFKTGIAIENLPLFPPFQFFTANVDELCQLVDRFNSSSVGICWDTGHANLLPYDQATVVRYMGERIVCTHLHDNNKDDDWHLIPCLGNVDWQSLMKALCEVGYNGPLTLECGGSGTEEQIYPEYVVQAYFNYCFNTLRYLEELYSQNA